MAKRPATRLVLSSSQSAGWVLVGSMSFPLVAALPVCVWALFATAPVPLTFSQRVSDALVSIPLVAMLVAVFEAPGALVAWLLLVSASMLRQQRSGGGFPATFLALGVMVTVFAFVLVGEGPFVHHLASAVELAPIAPVLLPIGFVGVLASPLLFKARRRRLRALVRLGRTP